VVGRELAVRELTVGGKPAGRGRTVGVKLPDGELTVEPELELPEWELTVELGLELPVWELTVELGLTVELRLAATRRLPVR
jgi:hypothetical protein